jgi:hypothetical protein
VILLAALALLAAAASGEIALPPRLAAVKWQNGRVAALAGSEAGPELLVWGPGQTSPRRFRLATAVGPARAIEVTDFALDESGTVHAAVYADFSLGHYGRLLCRFGEDGEAGCTGIGEQRCPALAAAGPHELWCVTTGPGGMALERVGGPRKGPRYWLPAETGGLEPSGSAAGIWLATPMPGLAWLYIGPRARLYWADLQSGTMKPVAIPVAPGSRSLPSFAAHGGRLVALYCLEGKGSGERLDAPYGLFELTDGGWVRVAPGRSWMRGARLAGMEAGAVWIWNRAERLLERVELPEGPEAGAQPR